MAEGFGFGLGLWTLCQGQAFQFCPHTISASYASPVTLYFLQVNITHSCKNTAVLNSNNNEVVTVNNSISANHILLKLVDKIIVSQI